MKKFNNGQISIIVPVYNAEKTIRKCVESVINQSYKNWELILVDDGSTDDSRSIINEYGKNNKNISIFMQKNLGVSSARNIGISNATGEYITFLDSDDYLNEKALEIMINALSNNDADMIVGSYSQITENGNKKNFIYKNKCIDLKEELLNISNLKFYMICWGKLYKTSIIIENNISFNLNFHLGEDTIFVFEYLKNVEKVACIDDVVYNVFIFEKDVSKRYNKTIVEKQYFIYREYKKLMECKGLVNDKRVEKFLMTRIKICINTSVTIGMKYDDLKEVFLRIVSLEEFKDLDTVIDNKYDYTIYKLLKNQKFRLLINMIKFKNFIMKCLGR